MATAKFTRRECTPAALSNIHYDRDHLTTPYGAAHNPARLKLLREAMCAVSAEPREGETDLERAARVLDLAADLQAATLGDAVLGECTQIEAELQAGRPPEPPELLDEATLYKRAMAALSNRKE